LLDEKLLIAGVIDTLTNIVEHLEVVADRIGPVAEVLGDPSKVLAANDCGFDTSADWGRVAPDVGWSKLRSLREGMKSLSSPSESNFRFQRAFFGTKDPPP